MISEVVISAAILTDERFLADQEFAMSAALEIAVSDFKAVIGERGVVGVTKQFRDSFRPAVTVTNGEVVGTVFSQSAHAQWIVRNTGPWTKNPAFFLIPWVRTFIGGTDAEIKSRAFMFGVAKMRSVHLGIPFQRIVAERTQAQVRAKFIEMLNFKHGVN